MTALKRGDYCCPSTEAEWKSILDLAEALGIGLKSIDKSQWGRCSFVWYSDTATSEGICELNSRSGYVFYRRIEVPDFIAGMYAMKEAKEKKPKVEFMGFAPDPPGTKSFSDAIKEAIEPLRQELLSANERITKLEGNPLWNVAHIVNRNWVFEKGASDAVMAIVQPLTDRIKALERRLNGHLMEYRYHQHQPQGGIVTVSPEIDMRECENAKKDVFSRPGPRIVQSNIDNDKKLVSVSDFDWGMVIDPKASPKNIPFSVALEYAKRGRLIKRTAWTNSVVATDGSPHGSLMLGDILASDWEVIQETKKP